MVALNSTAVTVSWTPVTLQETEYNYTVHYTTVCGDVNASFLASASSGVVSRLQEGLQYQFSVTLTFNVNGVLYTGRELKYCYKTLFMNQLFYSNIQCIHFTCSNIMSTSTVLIIALAVVGAMLLAALTGNVITTAYIVLLKRRLHTSKRYWQD